MSRTSMTAAAATLALVLSASIGSAVPNDSELYPNPGRVETPDLGGDEGDNDRDRATFDRPAREDRAQAAAQPLGRFPELFSLAYRFLIVP